jgi:hypothetical protein
VRHWEAGLSPCRLGIAGTGVCTSASNAEPSTASGTRCRLGSLAVVGILPPRRRDGWHQPDQISALFSVDEQGDAEGGTVAILQALVNGERLEFLG